MFGFLHSTSIYTNLKQEVKDDKFLEECWAPGVLLCFVGARLAIGYLLINYDNLTSTTIIASALYAVTLNFRFFKIRLLNMFKKQKILKYISTTVYVTVIDFSRHNQSYVKVAHNHFLLHQQDMKQVKLY